MTTRDLQESAHKERIHTADSIAAEISERLLAEGVKLLTEAARAVGVPASLWALHRAAMSGNLESIKVAGKRLTSEAAVLRWIAASSALPEREQRQPKRRRGGRSRPTTSEAAKRFLASRGLPTGGGQR